MLLTLLKYTYEVKTSFHYVKSYFFIKIFDWNKYFTFDFMKIVANKCTLNAHISFIRSDCEIYARIYSPEIQ